MSAELFSSLIRVSISALCRLGRRKANRKTLRRRRSRGAPRSDAAHPKPEDQVPLKSTALPTHLSVLPFSHTLHHPGFHHFSQRLTSELSTLGCCFYFCLVWGLFFFFLCSKTSELKFSLKNICFIIIVNEPVLQMASLGCFAGVL